MMSMTFSVPCSRIGVGAPADGASPSSSVEGLLSLPRSELLALLSDYGESGSKVLLALVYKLASLEAQLSDLRARVRKGPTSKAGPTYQVQAEMQSDLVDVLEQVFRKNLSLRKMG